MVCDLTNKKIKKILVTCSEEDRALYEVDADRYFESGYLRINAHEDKIQFENSYLSDGNYRPTFQGLKYVRSSVIRGFSITPIERDYRVFCLIRHIARTNSTAGTLITILDFSAPEPADLVTALAGNTEPYTTRAGRIYNVKPQQGSAGKNGDNMFISWSFKFQEALVRPED